MNSQFFKPTPGYDNCPKCFGWQVRDFTPRDFKGWPTGPADIRDCDHCGGRGEVKGVVKANPWACVDVAPAPPPGPIVIDDDVEAPFNINYAEGWIKPQPTPSGWPSDVPTHSTEHVASGWPSLAPKPVPEGFTEPTQDELAAQGGWPIFKEPGK